jgi:hypothetical protein
LPLVHYGNFWDWQTFWAWVATENPQSSRYEHPTLPTARTATNISSSTLLAVPLLIGNAFSNHITAARVGPHLVAGCLSRCIQLTCQQRIGKHIGFWALERRRLYPPLPAATWLNLTTRFYGFSQRNLHLYQSEGCAFADRVSRSVRHISDLPQIRDRSSAEIVIQ